MIGVPKGGSSQTVPRMAHSTKTGTAFSKRGGGGVAWDKRQSMGPFGLSPRLHTAYGGCKTGTTGGITSSHTTRGHFLRRRPLRVLSIVRLLNKFRGSIIRLDSRAQSSTSEWSLGPVQGDQTRYCRSNSAGGRGQCWTDKRREEKGGESISRGCLFGPKPCITHMKSSIII